MPELIHAAVLQPPAPARPLLRRKLTSWLQIVSHLSPQYGGIATTVPELARATESQGDLLCPVVGFCDATEIHSLPAGGGEQAGVFPPDRLRWLLDHRLRWKLKGKIRACSGVHIHGIWDVHCMAAATAAREAKRPYMISAHGMLEPWALRHKRFKKALYAALVERRRLQRAVCLRALSADEADDYRRVGLTNPIVIIPNSVDAQPSTGPDLFRAEHPELIGKRIVLFLGRLHAKKGLPLLLEAWSRKAPSSESLHLVIAGPDSGNVRALLEKMTDDLNLRSSVTFTGMLAGEHKWSALAAASLFVLPSYSEGFSVAVLEALGMGVPAIVTEACHVPEVSIHGCGWVIPPESEALRRALNEFQELSPSDVSGLGKRGRRLVRERFHPTVVGNQMASVYEWLQGGDAPPSVQIL